ncbi:MAG TPA: VCBS repeat-containing protein, partial [Opitutus sp.]|nr:VCBS repeat-containing protein [Opitutus sp.]
MFDLPLWRAFAADSFSSRKVWAGVAVFSATAIGGPMWAAAGYLEHPLAARSGPRGETLFVALRADATGVKAANSYADPAMWAERYQEANVGAVGTGVAIGDYDRDGRPDLFVVSKVETCRLFRNLGGFRFEDVTARTGVLDSSRAWKQGATFADVNNDGWLDVYVCRTAAANLLFVNQGDGTFKEEARARGLDFVGASSMAAFADYDRDGWLDVYLLTNLLDATRQPEGERDRLFRNNGDGTFTDVTERARIAGEGRGHSATWWDYDHDGWPDLYVANDFAPRDVLYRNKRDGTFTDQIHAAVPHHPFSSMGADVGDVNNDGLIDLLVADMAATTQEKDRRGMADSRARTRDPGAGEVPQYQRNALFLNTGTGVCLEAAFLAGLAATDWTWSSRFEDLDNDGRLDLHVTTGMNREQHNTDLLARMVTAQTPVERVRQMRSSPVFAERNLAYRNVGDLEFQDVSGAWGLQQSGVSFGSAFGDLDGDGDLDLVYGNYQADPTVLRNDSDSGHRLVVELVGTRSNRSGVGATVEIETAAGRQVRQLVLARGYGSSSEPTLHFGLGEQSEVDRLTVRWPSGHVQTFTGVPGDRRLTITEPEAAVEVSAPARGEKPAFIEVAASLRLDLRSEEDDRDPTLMQPLLPFRWHRRGPALAVGDLTGDGADELVFGGTTKTPLRVAQRETGGGYRIQELPKTDAGATSDGPVLIFDANGDGANDLLVAGGGANWPEGSAMYQPQLLVNDGAGGLSQAAEGALPPLPISAGAAVAADFNRDGALDVFIGGRLAPGRYPQAPRSALLINRGGRFEDGTASFAPGMEQAGLVTAALWTDVDDDGWIDLLVATEWGTIRCWRNLGGEKFAEWTEQGGFAAAGPAWWT